MALENKLNITDSAELARAEEKISKQKANRARRPIGFFLFWQYAIYAGIVGHWHRQSTKDFTFTAHRVIFGTVKHP